MAAKIVLRKTTDEELNRYGNKEQIIVLEQPEGTIRAFYNLDELDDALEDARQLACRARNCAVENRV